MNDELYQQLLQLQASIQKGIISENARHSIANGNEINHVSYIKTEQNREQNIKHEKENYHLSKANRNSNHRIYSGDNNNKEKPFQCCMCHKRFARRDYLKKHLRVHTGERPYRCSICLKSFKQKSGLNTHRKGVHKTSI